MKSANLETETVCLTSATSLRQCRATPVCHAVVSRADTSGVAGHLLFQTLMEIASAPLDITFACSHCASALVVDGAAAGLTLPCQRCGKLTAVPDISKRARETQKSNAQIADLRRQLKENESQRTEVTAYINQTTIQLHRWQLRLQTLDERRRELEGQLESPIHR